MGHLFQRLAQKRLYYLNQTRFVDSTIAHNIFKNQIIAHKDCQDKNGRGRFASSSTSTPDALEERGGGVARHEGQSHHPAAPGQYRFPAHDLVQLVVPAFHQDVGGDHGNELQGRVFGEQHHPIHAGLGPPRAEPGRLRG